MKPACLLLLALLVSHQALAAETPVPPKTQISEVVELVAADKFDRPESFTNPKQPGTGGWRGGIGKWSIQDGAAYAIQEGPSKNRPNGHEAVCEHIVDLGDYVFQAEFKMGTSPQVGFVCRDINKPNLHQGRILITPEAIWLQKMSGIAKETRREELKRIEIKIDPNTWHKVTIEVIGDHWFARIDDQTIEGHHERFKDRKGRIGMVARGEGAQFRNLALWSAKPKS
ncbi:family 16 glycoside hydrolase [Prosthecobacter sp. SYSU 5D2]|uniref:family 16 glycoside hydrolase n=1 Tax=Prosthecobacter sp. SYSU 5D2 TaxID=3134134 RepID=UPI0031FE9821